ncbi:MAG: hypothetical protein MUD16_03460 [Desulfobacterales bacterium]|jgi:hypothetical protein|nr:hypothetical protein [Desulfobacterales bacterium]
MRFAGGIREAVSQAPISIQLHDPRALNLPTLLAAYESGGAIFDFSGPPAAVGGEGSTDPSAAAFFRLTAEIEHLYRQLNN